MRDYLDTLDSVDLSCGLGCVSLSAGTWLNYGLGSALMVWGAICLAMGLLALRRRLT